MVRYIFRVFSCFILIATLVVNATAAPINVDTSTSSNPTGNSYQRKMFFDEGNSTHWLFHYNGSAIEYSYSTDAETWTSVGTLSYDTSNFAITHRVISGTSYVYLVAEANTHDIIIRRGTLSVNSIAFSGEQTVYDGNALTNRYLKPTLTLDDNNFIWVSSLHATSGQIVNVRRSTNANDISAWNATTTLGDNSPDLSAAILIPRNGSEIYLISAKDNQGISGFTFNGAAWSEENSDSDYSWMTFGPGGIFNGGNPNIKTYIYAIIVVGNNLYAGGSFIQADGNPNANYIARWDGNKWNSLGEGLSNRVYCLSESNGTIYAGGSFTDAGGDPDADYVAQFDGTSWGKIGSGGSINSNVYAIKSANGNIYIGGAFTDADGIAEADNIAMFDGTSWAALDGGLNGTVRAIESQGTNIYVAGEYTDAGGIGNADYIAYFDGTNWNAMGTGASASVFAIDVLGQDVYVGGNFTNIAGIASADYVARWNVDDQAWYAVGTPTGSGAFGQYIRSIKAITTNDIYAGGFINNVAGGATDLIMHFNGATWQAVGGGVGQYMQSVETLEVYDSNIMLGGTFTRVASENFYSALVSWDGANWSNLGQPGMSDKINAVAYDGNYLYMGGKFTSLMPGGVSYVARFDGTTWSGLGSGFGNGVNTEVFDFEIVGDDLYVAGNFENAGGVAAADDVARWDITDETWNALGSGVAGSSPSVSSIAAIGTDIYFGGNFLNAGGIAAADYIAMWDGANWNALGNSALGSSVYDILPLAGDIYIVGNFEDVDGIAEADYIARWDGANWHALGNGLPDSATSLASDGTNIYIAGSFENLNGDPDFDYLAKWDGATYSKVGDPLNSSLSNVHYANSRLYIAGYFSNASGVEDADGYAYLDGTSWKAIGLSGGGGWFNSIGNDIYVGAFTVTVTSSGVKGFLAKQVPIITNNINQNSEFSLVKNSSGDINLGFTDRLGFIKYKRFDEASDTWQDTVSINSTASSSPNLSLNNSNQRLTLSWIESNAIKSSWSLPSYTAPDWSNPGIVYNTGTNTAVIGAEYQQGSELDIVWVNGTSSPFDLLSDKVDATAPTVSITSNESTLTNENPISTTITFNEAVTGFTIPDINVANGSVTSLSGSGAVYTAEITPTVDGLLTIDVAQDIAIDALSNKNTAASQFSITYDGTAPTTTLSFAQGSSSIERSRNITITFSEDVTGFTQSDIVLTNATLSNFSQSSASSYTAKVTAVADGTISVNIPAAAAIDTAENQNTASATISYSYVTPAVIETTICSTWNSFFNGSNQNVWNIMEHVNNGNSQMNIRTTLYDVAGQSQSTRLFSIGAGEQSDLLIHEMNGWTENSYGLVCSEVVDGSLSDLDGRMVYYKMSDQGETEYVISADFTQGLSGNQYINFNTYQPSSNYEDYDKLVSNWIRISNPGNTDQTGTVRIFDQKGTLLETREITVVAKGQNDQAIHSVGSNNVGVVIWQPKSSTAKFKVLHARYLHKTDNTFYGASQTSASKGFYQLASAEIDTNGMSSILELSNITESRVSSTIKFYDSNGILLSELNLEPDAYETLHIIADSILASSSGLMTIQSPEATSASLIANVYQYSHEAIGSVNFSYAISAQSPQNTTLKSSYNTFLDQSCELYLSNPNDQAHTVTVAMTRNTGTSIFQNSEIELLPYSSVISNICSTQSEPSYGTVTVVADAANKIVSHLVRISKGNSHRVSLEVQ